MGEGRYDIRWQHAEAAEMALGEARSAASTEDAFQMGQIMRTGEWLLMTPYTVNGTELGTKEWGDSLFLSYGINPPDSTDHCNVCGMEFDICHTLH